MLVEKVVSTRATLSHYLEGLQQHIAAQRATAAISSGASPWEEPVLGAFVLHSKERPREASLPKGVLDEPGHYFVAENVGSDVHISYPFHVEGSLVHAPSK